MAKIYMNLGFDFVMQANAWRFMVYFHVNEVNTINISDRVSIVIHIIQQNRRSSLHFVHFIEVYQNIFG